MADIALLVTEEFEKKLKRGAPGEEAEAASRRNFGAVMKVCSSWMESASAAAAGVKVNVARINVVEPKTAISSAAMDAVFSA
uniref:Uncharacterized protein n=1 Tax=Leersia perrieri TaxID=77586 RepID=A0A0D9VQ29_9ORYZ